MVLPTPIQSVLIWSLYWGGLPIGFVIGVLWARDMDMLRQP